MRTNLAALGLFLLCAGIAPFSKATDCDANAALGLVRHAIVVNGSGRVEGSLQQMLGEPIVFNGSNVITGDVLVPGSPSVRLNGNNAFGGVVQGSGNAAPGGYQITLNGNVTLRNLVTRTNPVAIPSVAPIPLSKGTRSVILTAPNSKAGDFATIKNLILNGNLGEVAIPPGTYAEFTANGNNGFVLGVAGSVTPTVYNFQRLIVNGKGNIRLLGPVVLSIANEFIANGMVGSTDSPFWLEIRVCSGGITVNGNSRVFAKGLSPNGTITLNGNSQWTGEIACDKLIVNHGSLLRLISSNSAPVAISQELHTPYAKPLSVVLIGADPDDDALTFALDTQPQHGSIAGFDPATGQLTYTPANHFSGVDSFRFHVSDGVCPSDPAAVSLIVGPPPVPPIARPDSYSTDQGVLLSVPAPGLLVNDTDPAGLPLSASVTSNPSSGTLVLQPNGSFTFMPSGGFAGAVVFTYEASNGWTGATAEARIEVKRVNLPPDAIPQSLRTGQNEALSIILAGQDPENESMTFAVASEPSNGALIGAGPTLQYLPKAGFSGVDQFEFLVTDPHGAQGQATVKIAVGRVNTAPIAVFTADPTVEDSFCLVSFDGAGSYDLDGQVVRYDWDFDNDGVADAQGPTPQQRFLKTTTPVVCLTVTDNEGATGSVSRTLRFNQSPTVAIENPTSRAVYYDTDPIDLVVKAMDPDGEVAKTVLYLDGQIIGELIGAQKVYPLGVLPPGQYSVQAVAFDLLGATGRSTQVSFEVRARAGNFIVHPLQRSAALAAVAGAAEIGGLPPEQRVNTTQQPLFADNYYTAPVDYTLTLIDNLAGTTTGYMVFDSRTSNKALYKWDPIASPENKLTEVSNTDRGFQEVALPFPFEFYGNTYSKVQVSPNGFLSFAATEDVDWPQTIPSTSAPSAMLAAFWDDLCTYGEDGTSSYSGASRDQGAVYYKEYDDRVVFQYTGDSEFLGWSWDPHPAAGIFRYNGNGFCNFQIVLFKNGSIEYHYAKMGGWLGGATIGIQNETGDNGIQIAAGTKFVTSNMALRFERALARGPWFTVDRQSGHLAPGAKDSLVINYFARADFQPGRHAGRIRVDHTQPGLEPYLVDVSLNIEEQVPTVRFVDPPQDAKCYYFAGAPTHLSMEASDQDGHIRSVTLTANGAPLTTFRAPPYALQWSPAVGEYKLEAVATDDTGHASTPAEVLVSVSADSDGDMLPDAWELDFLGSLDHGATSDYDGDGRSNRLEFVERTSPIAFDEGPINHYSPTAEIQTTRLSGQAPFSVRFDASTSSDLDGEIVGWNWDLDGDGLFDASGMIVSHIYDVAGVYPVTLHIVDNDGYTATKQSQVSVKAAGLAIEPEAIFDALPYAAEASFKVSFDASRSVDRDGVIESYSWDFGDGSGESGLRVAHIYSDVGLYEVTLRVTDNDGLVSTMAKRVTVTDFDRALFAANGGFLVMEAEEFTGRDQRNDLSAWQLSGGTRAVIVTDLDSADSEDSEGIELVSHIPPMGGESSCSWEQGAEVSWLVNVTSPGTYFVALRARGYDFSGTTGEHSVRIGVDDVETTGPDGAWVGPSSAMIWRRGGSLGYLDIGVHRVQVRRRFGNVQIDQIAISTDKDRLPAIGSQGPALPSQRNALAVRRRGAPRIEESVTAPGLPYCVTAAAGKSAIQDGQIVRYSWYLASNKLNKSGNLIPQCEYLGEGPTYSLVLNDFNPDCRGVGLEFGAYRLGLVLQDELGNLYRRETSITPVDSIESAVTESAVVVDNEDSNFSAGAAWIRGKAENLWVRGQYYPGGWDEYWTENPPPPMSFGGQLVDYDSVHAANMYGNGFALCVGSATQKARFNLTVPEAGEYLVFCRFPATGYHGWADLKGDLASKRAPYVLHSAEGTETIAVDQRIGGGHWRLIAARRFDAGSGGYVEVSADPDGHFVYADAVCLVKIPNAGANLLPRAHIEVTVAEDQSAHFDGSNSSDADGSIQTYLWDFGDGTQSRAASPTHRYATPGNYTARLTVIDQQLGVSMASAEVTVGSVSVSAAPVARLQLSAIRGRIPFTVKCDASASTDDQAVVAYDWGIGNDDATSGFGGHGPTATRVLGTPGVYPIVVSVRDSHGQTDSVKLEVEAISDGMAEGREFIVDSEDSFFIHKSGQWDRITNYTKQPGCFAIHGNNSAGFFGGSYLETNRAGAALSIFPELPHSGLYQIFWRYPYETSDVPVSIEVLDRNGVSHLAVNSSKARGQWYLLGTFSCAGGNGTAVTIRCERDGQYLPFDAIKWVEVDDGVAANFAYTMTQETAPADVSFDGTASRAATSIASYAWDFGDGATGVGAMASHRYVIAGLFEAKLKVVDVQGNAAECSRWVRATAPDVPGSVSMTISPAAGVAPLMVQCDATGTEDADGIREYSWDFGDGATATGLNCSHRYLVPGQYFVTLKVFDDRGYTSELTRQVVVASATGSSTRSIVSGGSTGGNPLALQFALNGLGESSQVNWSFGDGQSGTGASIVHQYAAVGVYEVIATEIDQGGSVIVARRWVIVPDTGGTAPPEGPQDPEAKLILYTPLATPGQ